MHNSPVLQCLHWLPVKYRIDFKILLLTFMALHNLVPLYLTDLLLIYTPSRTLRSSLSISLVSPHIRLCTMGARTFNYLTPRLWNSLPPIYTTVTVCIILNLVLRFISLPKLFYDLLLLSLYCIYDAYMQLCC